MNFFICVARLVSWIGLTAVGVVHAVWAAGSPWPLKDRRELAEAVVGSNELPDSKATAVVAATALVGGVVAGGAFGEGALPVALRRGAGVALLTRAAIGGETALALLGLPKAGKRFVELDNRLYRPFCAMLGVALLVAARHRRKEKAVAEILATSESAAESSPTA